MQRLGLGLLITLLGIMSRIEKLLRRLRNIFKMEASVGLLLMGTTVLALFVANSPLRTQYQALLDLPVEIRIGHFEIAKPLLLWINDGLMALFFLLVGMELKREVVEGHLSSLRRASLPAFAAVGGMLGPSFLYSALNWHDSAAMRGWAIPTATDIAFALGVLALLGNKVPAALRAFLLSIAIFDDLGAIVVIALFYTAKLSFYFLGLAALLLVGLTCLNLLRVRKPEVYLILGIPLWVTLLKSGVHATLAGVLLAMFIPLSNPESPAMGDSPLHKLEHALHPWVAFGVLPIFAFANAGVSLSGVAIADAFHSVPFGITIGLFVGKQLGIMLLCWIPVKLRIAALPNAINWKEVYGASLLCGVGFTMSLFIASLAFEESGIDFHGLERLGILIGSFFSGVFGYLVLRKVIHRPTVKHT